MESIANSVAAVLIGFVLAVAAVAWIFRSPFLWGQFQNVIAEMNRDNQQLRTDLAANDKAIREVSRELRRAEARIDELEEHAEDAARHNELLANRLRALGKIDIPPAPQPPPRKETPRPAGAGGSWSELAKQVAERFSIEEIDDLALELGLLEAVAGASQETRASSLVLKAFQRGVLEELRSIARQKRPRGGF